MYNEYLNVWILKFMAKRLRKLSALDYSLEKMDGSYTKNIVLRNRYYKKCQNMTLF